MRLDWIQGWRRKINDEMDIRTVIYQMYEVESSFNMSSIVQPIFYVNHYKVRLYRMLIILPNKVVFGINLVKLTIMLLKKNTNKIK